MADERKVDERGREERPLDSPVGGEADVESVAEEITSRQISAQTYGGDPAVERRDRLKGFIAELEARAEASDRGEDLEPLLEEARSSLKIVEEEVRKEQL